MVKKVEGGEPTFDMAPWRGGLTDTILIVLVLGSTPASAFIFFFFSWVQSPLLGCYYCCLVWLRVTRSYRAPSKGGYKCIQATMRLLGVAGIGL